MSARTSHEDVSRQDRKAGRESFSLESSALSAFSIVESDDMTRSRRTSNSSSLYRRDVALELSLSGTASVLRHSSSGNSKTSTRDIAMNSTNSSEQWQKGVAPGARGEERDSGAAIDDPHRPGSSSRLRTSCKAKKVDKDGHMLRRGKQQNSRQHGASVHKKIRESWSQNGSSRLSRGDSGPSSRVSLSSATSGQVQFPADFERRRAVKKQKRSEADEDRTCLGESLKCLWKNGVVNCVMQAVAKQQTRKEQMNTNSGPFAPPPPPPPPEFYDGARHDANDGAPPSCRVYPHDATGAAAQVVNKHLRLDLQRHQMAALQRQRKQLFL
ncbi:unnamed protein product [Amoebophrya sp. A25]|nr:unnamed protein product [Amoebophrya sp. A25]|eukprot:GSA25T00001214001.1